MSLAIIGLSLDVIGVFILGFDLLHLQRRLRSEAQDRLNAIQEVLDNHANTEGYLSDIARGADWREGGIEEGRWEPHGGTFDYSAARTSFGDLSDTVAALASDMKVLAGLNHAAVLADKRTANRSIWLTGLGLGLIGMGFALQIAALLT